MKKVGEEGAGRIKVACTKNRERGQEGPYTFAEALWKSSRKSWEKKKVGKKTRMRTEGGTLFLFTLEKRTCKCYNSEWGKRAGGPLSMRA